MPLQLEIVTPEARIFSDEVDSVVLPGFEGEMGVLPMHAPLVTTLQPGELRFMKAGKETGMAVGEGLAVNADDIDEKAVEEALERAQKALSDVKEGEHQEDVAAAMAAIQRATAQLHVKRRRKTI